MATSIRIHMMGEFCIYVNERQIEKLVNKSRKGTMLIQYLILEDSKGVPNHRLLEALWPGDQSSNPEGALKTLVSRVRVILNQIMPGLGASIVSERGSYRWKPIEGMSIDLYEIRQLLDALSGPVEDGPEARAQFSELMKLYTGDLLQGAESLEWAIGRSVDLHNRYVDTVCRYLKMLEDKEEYEECIHVCRTALNADAFDERLHLALMNALIKLGRNNEALMQYKHATDMHLRYLGVQPPPAIQEFYKRIIQADKTLDFNLESIRNELREHAETGGAFLCEYAVFREIYNLQMRNLKRLGSTMFLGLIMVTSTKEEEVQTPLKQSELMQALLEILQENLRRGDTITQFSPTMAALLLPTVDYSTGNIVMERVKRSFFRKFPNSDVLFKWRVGPLYSENKKGNP